LRTSWRPNCRSERPTAISITKAAAPKIADQLHGATGRCDPACPSSRRVGVRHGIRSPEEVTILAVVGIPPHGRPFGPAGLAWLATDLAVLLWRWTPHSG
jgi:hypothetical protein